ncbi:MAG TPA: hypothetical protein VHN79_01230 [Lacunisphaera sp.]|nr:hypothetical protein [Lacunisphaera sp.]
MKRCYPYRRLAALALLALLPLAHATTVIAPSFDGLVDSSDYIVRATVKSITSEWRDNPDKPGTRYIGSKITLEVHEVIKGNPPSPLVLDLVGGRVGDETLTVDGAPEFITGQENILFVKGNGRRVVPLVGMMHGRYMIRRDKRTGLDEVVRNNGQPLYSEQDVSLPPAAVSSASAAPKARALTAADFAQSIRKAAKFRDRESHK